MCPNCDAFSEQRTFKTPADYVAFVRQLAAEAESGRFVLGYGDCALEELEESSPRPAGDTICHGLQCAKCGQSFRLFANVWNGRNSWGPLSAEEWAAERDYYTR